MDIMTPWKDEKRLRKVIIKCQISNTHQRQNIVIFRQNDAIKGNFKLWSLSLTFFVVINKAPGLWAIALNTEFTIRIASRSA